MQNMKNKSNIYGCHDTCNLGYKSVFKCGSIKINYITPNDTLLGYECDIQKKKKAQHDIFNPLESKKNWMNKVYNLYNIKNWVGYNYKPKP